MTRRTRQGEVMTDLILEIFRANGRLVAAGDALTRPHRQSGARWQVLGAIRTGPETVAGVARIMGLTRQSVQRTTDLLAHEGLVEYLDNPAHRRAKLVQLSDQGRQFLQKLAPVQAAWVNRLAARVGFPASDLETACEVVHAVRVHLEEDQRGSASQQGLS